MPRHRRQIDNNDGQVLKRRRGDALPRIARVLRRIAPRCPRTRPPPFRAGAAPAASAADERRSAATASVALYGFVAWIGTHIAFVLFVLWA